MLEERIVNSAVYLAYADSGNEIAYGSRRIASSSETGYGRHTRVVPAVYIVFFYKLNELALAENYVVYVETRKFRLLRMEYSELIEEPVIKRSVILKFKRAE